MLLSFCIPAYNDEKYINSCIDSILNQTNNNFEIIIVDDGSTDRTSNICDVYSENNKNIHVFHQKNSGRCVARNLCIEKAKGDWICFADHDDLISPYCVRVLESISERDNFDIISYNSIDFKDGFTVDYKIDSVLYKRIYDAKKLWKINLYEYPSEKIGKHRITTPWGKFYKTEFLKENSISNIPKLTWCEDVCFNMQAYYYTDKILFIDEDLYFFRENNRSFGRKYTETLHYDAIDVAKTLISETSKFRSSEVLESEISKRLSNRLLSICNKMLDCDILHIDNKKSYKDKRIDFDIFVNNKIISDIFKTIGFSDAIGESKKYYFFIKYKIFSILYAYSRIKYILKKYLIS